MGMASKGRGEELPPVEYDQARQGGYHAWNEQALRNPPNPASPKAANREALGLLFCVLAVVGLLAWVMAPRSPLSCATSRMPGGGVLSWVGRP